MNNLDILDDVMGYCLDKYQRDVIFSNEDAILVLAGAGSGKSLTIIGKIIYLIKELNIGLDEILVISLTNDACNSLKNKIYNYYGYEIDVLTFHKLALLILKDNDLEYQIANEDMLDSVIDDFFENHINTKIINRAYKYLIKDDKDLVKIKNTIKTFIHLFKSSNRDISYYKYILKRIKYTFSYKKYKKNKYLLLFIINIYLLYENSLKMGEYIDFEDMINKSIEVLDKYGIKRKWKYIIIDEYQDSSYIKVKMIQRIMSIMSSKLLVVGDDFQSIYRFTGSDLEVFLNFEEYFNNSIIMEIKNTYRNPQELIDIAGSFIMKNNKQLRKELVSNKHLDKPIKIVCTNKYILLLKELLINNRDKEIMIIGRNNKDINYYIDNEYKYLEDNYYEYNNVRFRYFTIHKSKGLEADVVIMINVSSNINSIPSKIVEEDILKYVKKNKDYYPYEEERRLFYVGLTRTRSYIYIISDKNKESIFIKELKKYRNVEIIKR